MFDRLETPSQLAAQLINKLEKHKKILEKETRLENNLVAEVLPDS